MDAEVALVKSAERKMVAESRCGKRIGRRNGCQARSDGRVIVYK